MGGLLLSEVRALRKEILFSIVSLGELLKL